MFTYEIFVENIRQIITKKGFKQRAVAERAGYDEQQFSNMLNGRRTIKATEVPAIAEALGVTPNDLFNTKACSNLDMNPPYAS